MASLGLDGGVTVARGSEPGPHANDHGSHVDAGAEVALGEDGVHEHGGREVGDAGGLGVNQDGHLTACDDGERLGNVVRQASANALNLAGAQADGLGEAHRAPDGGGSRQVAHDHLAPRAIKPEGDAGGDVPGAANLYEHGLSPSFWRGRTATHLSAWNPQAFALSRHRRGATRRNRLTSARNGSSVVHN